MIQMLLPVAQVFLLGGPVCAMRRGMCIVTEANACGEGSNFNPKNLFEGWRRLLCFRSDESCQYTSISQDAFLRWVGEHKEFQVFEPSVLLMHMPPSQYDSPSVA